MPRRLLLAFSILILNGAPLFAQEAQRSVDRESALQASSAPEGDYDRREREAGDLDQFRGGGAAGPLEIFMFPVMVVTGLAKLVAWVVGKC